MYTLRHLDESLPEIIDRVASSGFEGVEFAGVIPDTEATAVRDRLDATGTVPVGAHVDLRTLESLSETAMESIHTVGVDRLIIPHISIDHFRTRARLANLVERISELSETLSRSGLTLALHTDRMIMLPFLGKPGYLRLNRFDGLPTGAYNHLSWVASRSVPRTGATLREQTPLGYIATHVEGLGLEIDIKSIAQSGYAYETVFETFEEDCSLVHVSDVTQTRRIPPAYQPVDIGEGMVNTTLALDALERYPVDWLVAEHDNPDDPIASLDRCAAAVSASHAPVPPL